MFANYIFIGFKNLINNIWCHKISTLYVFISLKLRNYHIIIYILFVVLIYHSFPNIVIVKTMFESQLCKIKSKYFTTEHFQITKV